MALCCCNGCCWLDGGRFSPVQRAVGQNGSQQGLGSRWTATSQWLVCGPRHARVDTGPHKRRLAALNKVIGRSQSTMLHTLSLGRSHSTVKSPLILSVSLQARASTTAAVPPALRPVASGDVELPQLETIAMAFLFCTGVCPDPLHITAAMHIRRHHDCGWRRRRQRAAARPLRQRSSGGCSARQP